VETPITIVIALVLGAVPTAYLVGRALRGIDVRRSGSGNVGALNAYRQLGKPAGLAGLVLDAAKGAAVILIGQRLGAPDLALYTAGVAAALGHNFSPFLRFRGGKGAAVVLGISAIMLWEITAITVVVGAALFAVTRHAMWSMSGILLLLNVLTIATQQPIGQIGLCLVLSFVVAGTHLIRQRPQILPALRRKQWRRIMTIE
jgi:glycerol-3-phosphate acyltransferase PlsY